MSFSEDALPKVGGFIAPRGSLSLGMRRRDTELGLRRPPSSLDSGKATGAHLAGVLGFCLPLAGGFPLGQWIPGYPSEMTIIRVVTLVSFIWFINNTRSTPLPLPTRRMIQGFVALLGYAAISVLWSPDATNGFQKVVSVAMAMATGVALLLLVRNDRRSLRIFGIGVLWAATIQVAIAVIELLTDKHVMQRNATTVEQWELAKADAAYGTIVFGTLGNPNDLGGFWLLAAAVFFGAQAFGLAWRKGPLLIGALLLATSVTIGLTSMNDARAFRLGLAVLAAMLVFELLFGLIGTDRRPLMVIILSVVAVLLVAIGPTAINRLSDSGGSDALRHSLFMKGISTGLESGGVGRGIGSESAMIESGEIATNFHSFIAQMSAELGFVITGIFMVYLLRIFLSWMFVSPCASDNGRVCAFARASIVVGLVLYGSTSSGTLDSPIFWAFVAVTALLAPGSKKDHAAAEGRKSLNKSLQLVGSK